MRKKMDRFIIISLIILLIISSITPLVVKEQTISAFATSKTTMTRQGDTVWFGYYPQTVATDDELSKMSTLPNNDGFYTSGKDKFVKVTSSKPEHAYHNGDNEYLKFDNGELPAEGETYYFKMEPIEWKVLIDDSETDTIKLVSQKLIDTHVWLSQYQKSQTRDGWSAYDNTLENVPAETPANGWRYSEMRAFLNGEFYNFAFTEIERESILLFANTHTIDYRENDESTIVNDYVAIGNRTDYNEAGDDARPSDYAIVKGVRWQYNKDNCAYYVNANASMFPEEDIRGYISGDHEQVLVINGSHGIRPIIYARRSDAKILATQSQKKETGKNLMLIVGIVSAVAGAGLAVPVMITTGKKQKASIKETGKDYRLTKKELTRITPGLVFLICGIMLVVLNFALFGGIGTKLSPGIYVQQNQYSGGGIAQVGYCAYNLNSDGTFDYTDGYNNGKSTIWSGHGTYTINGNKITFVWKGNPIVQEGYTFSATIYDSTTFGTSYEKYKKN